MVAETLREVGLLVLVFGLLDERFRYVGEMTHSETAAVDWLWVVIVLLAGLYFVWSGIFLDWLLWWLVRRERENLA
jgi:hypothetical protein